MIDNEHYTTFAKSKGFKPIMTLIINNLDFIHDNGLYIAPISVKELLEHYAKEKSVWWDYDGVEHYDTAKDIAEFYWDDWEEYCAENGLKVI